MATSVSAAAAAALDEVPVLDLQDDTDAAAQCMDAALRRFGFFYVRNHGIPEALLAQQCVSKGGRLQLDPERGATDHRRWCALQVRGCRRDLCAARRHQGGDAVRPVAGHRLPGGGGPAARRNGCACAWRHQGTCCARGAAALRVAAWRCAGQLRCGGAPCRAACVARAAGVVAGPQWGTLAKGHRLQGLTPARLSLCAGGFPDDQQRAAARRGARARA